MEQAHYKQIEAIRKITSKNTVFADIGACKGDILGVLCDSCNKGYAFEPDINNFHILQEKFNGKSVEILNVVVSNINDKIKFYNRGDYIGNILGHDMDYRKYSSYVLVDSVTIDSFFADKEIDFVKMDIEGAEWMAFEKAQETLKNKNIVFQVEFHLDEDWNKRHMLYDLGYDVFTLDFQKLDRSSKRIYQGIVARSEWSFQI
jgi:FkbM family methyltransferase